MKKILLIPLLLLLLLLFRVFLFFQFQPQVKVGEVAQLKLTLLQDPSISGKRATYAASYGNLLSSIPVKVVVPLGKVPSYQYGGTLNISGKISQDTYGNWLVSFPKIVVQPKLQNPLFLSIGKIREKITTIFQNDLPQPLSTLLLGIVFGIKGNIPKDFLSSLQATGVVHIVAASGMNVTMAGEFVMGMLAFLFSRRNAIFLSIIGVWLYVLLAGLQASILRAAFMVSLAMVGQLLGRQYSSMWAIAIAGLLMVGINPRVVGDVGFQLSFLSTIGILTIQPLLIKLPIVKEDLATTIAAQLATLPILLISFGQYGLFSILVNGLILWTIPILMILGSIAAFFAILLPILCKFILIFTLPLLWFVQQVVGYFGELGIVVRLGNLPIPIIVGYYCLLASVVIFWRGKRDLSS